MQNYPNAGYAWFVVLVLCAAYAVSYVDRQVLALLIVPIQNDLHLSDTRISLLYGLAFTLSYTLMGLPFGRLADRFNRSSIIALGAGTWSAMTLCCGLAQNAMQLFAARLGVGMGEASLSPSAFSLIADYFPPGRRAAAISTYVLGAPLGAGCALLGGGAIIGVIMAKGAVELPLFGLRSPWRMTFALVALPGLLVALLMLAVREVPRKERLTGLAEVNAAAAMCFVRPRWRLYGCHSLGIGVLSLLANGYSAWAPTYFMRKFGWTTAEAGIRFGSILVVFGVGGVLAGGILASALARRGIPRASFITVFFGAACLTPLAVAAALAPSATWAAVLFGPYMFFALFPTGCAAAALLEVTPNEIRGYVSAIYLFVVSTIGMALGPSSIALVTDFVFRDKAAIGQSMAIVAGVAGPLSAYLLYQSFLAARHEAGLDERPGLAVE